MVNKALFQTSRGKTPPEADTRNRAGGLAYQMSDQLALVQYAVTNCFNNTFYARAEEHLETTKQLCDRVDPTFIAQTAVYSRERGYMKDMPAFLTAYLAGHGEIDLVKAIFPKTIDNGKQLKNFAQIIRSGVTGRKSFGTATRNVIRDWLAGRTDKQLFNDAVGGEVSLADLIKMVHPKPADKTRSAFYAYLIGKTEKYAIKNLPELVRHYEKFKAGDTKEVPDVNFQYLTSLNIDKATWKEIARNARWMMTRMNINTFMRHGVFEGRDGKELINLIAKRLADPNEIKRARAFPYQLMAAYLNTGDAPREITLALQEAAEIACENVPVYEGNVVICPDVSGSMSSPITGDRGSASTKMRCIDIAAMVSAVYLRKNKLARVIPFEGHVVNVRLNPNDSIMTNAEILSRIGGGSTECAAPLALLNQERAKVDLIIIVSDQESWVNSYRRSYGATPLMNQWAALKSRCPNAKMVLIDIQAGTDSQAPEHNPDILNVGGWSDTVFEVINDFISGGGASDAMVAAVEAIKLNGEPDEVYPKSRRRSESVPSKAKPKEKSKAKAKKKVKAAKKKRR